MTSYQTYLDRNGDSLHELLQLQFLLLPHGDVPELPGEREHAEELNLREVGLEESVVRHHGVVGHVVVTTDTT